MQAAAERTRRWKGKARAATPAIEGSGASDGVVLPMDLIGGGIYDAAYVVSITVGRQSNPQSFSLQVDSGSSDLWIAASSCSTSSCRNSGATYNPSSSHANATGAEFTIQYLQGEVDGPVYWDKVVVGGYSIENQALAAGTTINNEPLSAQFNGILGIALPLNSVIAQQLPPVTTNDPDGAAWASNLFSITPTLNAPTARFISMTLTRPDAPTTPSLLGIGRHPAYLQPQVDAGAVQYAGLVSDRMGTLFWKTSVRGITVYAGGVRMPVNIGRGVMGSPYPTAVLDSGVPYIYMSSAVANGIYGAVGVQPASDGLYYVPCTTPINMTITLDNRTEIPLHPLDITATAPWPNQDSPSCVGLIQSADAQLAQPNTVGDMILGVPFLRNVYMVMAYVEPGPGGVFEAVVSPDAVAEEGSGENGVAGGGGASNSNSSSGAAAAAAGATATTMITPYLGLLGLTDPTVALDEFHTVRVLRAPVSPTNSSGGSGGANGKNPLNAEGADGGRKISVGVIVIIALVSFFALCFVLFGVRWWVMRRRYRRNGGFGGGGGGGGEGESGSATPGEGIAKAEMAMLSVGGGGGYQLAHQMVAGTTTTGGSVSSSSLGRGEGNVNAKDGDHVDGVGGMGGGGGGGLGVGAVVAIGGGASKTLPKRQTTKSTSTMHTDGGGGYEDVWDAHTAMPVLWPTKSFKARSSREGERPRNDSSTLPLELEAARQREGRHQVNESIDSYYRGGYADGGNGSEGEGDGRVYHARTESEEREVRGGGDGGDLVVVPLLEDVSETPLRSPPPGSSSFPASSSSTTSHSSVTKVPIPASSSVSSTTSFSLPTRRRHHPNSPSDSSATSASSGERMVPPRRSQTDSTPLTSSTTVGDFDELVGSPLSSSLSSSFAFPVPLYPHPPLPPPPSRLLPPSSLSNPTKNEFDVDMTMIGVGTASRTKKMSVDGVFVGKIQAESYMVDGGGRFGQAF